MANKANMSKFERKFFDVLERVFIGDKAVRPYTAENKSGFLKLIRYKSSYFNNIVYPSIKEKIKKAVTAEKLDDEKGSFSDDLYTKLYDFFSRYFSETGSVFYSNILDRDNIYKKLYAQGGDTALFWKTQGLYYVKSETIYNNMEVEIDTESGNNAMFYFNCDKLLPLGANIKKELIFNYGGIIKISGKDAVKLIADYNGKTRVTKTDEILKAVKKDYEQKLQTEDIESAVTKFKKQSEVDFFINKNARKFLQEELNTYMYNFIFVHSPDTIFEQKRLRQLQAVRDVALEVIKHFSQFEDELVRIWNKPKFVFNTNYVVTLGRIDDKDKSIKKEVLKKVINAVKKEKKQLTEWQQLGFIGDKFKITDVLESGPATPRLPGMDVKTFGRVVNERYQHLPIDTKYLSEELKLEILGLFENLDDAIDGTLIKSDNYQALNTILPKYREKIQTIYIDPPFNLGKNADFNYKVGYKDATWATLLENRLELAKYLLNKKGSIFVRCDYNGNYLVRHLLDNIFGEDNFSNEIISAKSNRIKTEGNKFLSWHDTLFFYSKNSENQKFNHLKLSKDIKEWRAIDNDGESWAKIPLEIKAKLSPKNVKIDKNKNPISKARIILGKEFLPPTGRRFPSQESIWEMEKSGIIRLNSNGNPQMLKPSSVYLTDNWTDIFGYSSRWDFSTENSEKLLHRVIKTASNDPLCHCEGAKRPKQSHNTKDIICDFFLGSGTTIATAHKLGRKWLGVEMGEHFYTVILPRMKKVLFYDKSGISKEVKTYKGGGFFKYYELESYEETLRKAKYDNNNEILDKVNNIYDEYMFLGDKKLVECIEIDKKRKTLNINLKKLYNAKHDGKQIDLAETISNITGREIKRIEKDAVYFTNGTKQNFDTAKMTETEKIDFLRVIRDLIWWGK